MRWLIAAAAFVATTAPVTAFAQNSTGTPDVIAERFLQSLKSGQVEDAIKGVASNSQLLATRLAADPTLATQIETAIKLYGPVLGWERVASDPLGTLVRRDTYLVQHRDMVTRWRFFYIRTSKGWATGSFAFEDQLPNWFDQSQ